MNKEFLAAIDTLEKGREKPSRPLKCPDLRLQAQLQYRS